MAAATNQQVQVFSDTRLRPLCEAARTLAAMCTDNIAEINDVYTALTEGSPTWTDARTDGPPSLLSVGDLLAINAFMHDILTAITGDGNYAVVSRACVRPVPTV